MEARSNGHIAFIQPVEGYTPFELYERDGLIFRAPLGNAFDVRSGSRVGRFECKPEALNVLFSMLEKGGARVIR